MKNRKILKLKFRKICTIGFETNQRIYKLEKHVNSNSVNDFINEKLFGKDFMHIIVPSNNKNTVSKLIQLDSIKEDIANNKGDYIFLKGFIKENKKFDRTLCVASNASSLPQKIKNVLRFSVDKGTFTLRENGQHKLVDYTLNEYKTPAKYCLSEFTACHPVFDNDNSRAVFKSLQQSIQVLSQVPLTESISNILDEEFFDKVRKEVSCTQNSQRKHPFIVVEGLDGTGKSTMVRNLSRYLNAKCMVTPPSSISSIRKDFDNFPELVRRAYYAMGNYIAVPKIIKETQRMPVVMDRFWHSTTAYAIAKETDVGITEYLPSEHHDIYKWPEDLLQPDAVLFLKTSEGNRENRVNKREYLTNEEERINENKRFRARIMHAYRMIGHSNWIEVDTSGTQQDSLQDAVNALQGKGII